MTPSTIKMEISLTWKMINFFLHNKYFCLNDKMEDFNIETVRIT